MNRSMELTNDKGCTATERCAVVPTHAGRQRILTAVRWISSLLIVAALLTIVRALPIDQAMGAIKGWTAGLGIWGPVVLALVYIVATVLFVPGTILTLAAGGMFGLVVGTITVSIGSTLGASLAFLIARYVAREKVAARASRNRRFGAIDRAIGEGGWKIVALLRLSPAIPFNLQNYLYGLTPIRFWPYVLTSWLAMLPGTFLYVYLGHIAGAAVGADRSRTASEWAMLAVGLLATVVVTVYVTRLARRKLQEQMNEAAEEEASPVTEDDAQRAPGNGVRLRGTVMLAAAALIMAAAAVALAANATAFERWLTGLFGPPRVELKEAYGAAGAESNASEASFDHSALDALLRQYVDADGWVDYAGLQADQARLDAYLAAVADAPFDALGRDDPSCLDEQLVAQEGNPDKPLIVQADVGLDVTIGAHLPSQTTIFFVMSTSGEVKKRYTYGVPQLYCSSFARHRQTCRPQSACRGSYFISSRLTAITNIPATSPHTLSCPLP